MKNLLHRSACIGMLLMASAVTASAENFLVNPGFEDGPTGGGAASWFTFGNVYTEADNGFQFIPNNGTKLVSMFGNFSGGFNVTGFFQEFPAAPGSEWEMASFARYFSGDPMVGSVGTGGNWVVQKIVFKDAADVELPGAVESIILDGSFAPDTWHYAAPIMATAPLGTVQVEAFVLYLQPNFDGGAAHIDDVYFGPVGPISNDDSSWSAIKAQFND